MHEKDSDIDFDLNSESDFELTEKNKKQKNNNLSIEKLKKDLGHAPAPEENGGIIQGNLNILILSGSGGFLANNCVNKILCNGTAIEGKFDENKCFDTQTVQGGCANVTLLRCDEVTVKNNNSNFRDFCSYNAKEYDLIVVLGLDETSEKNVLDFVANKIKNGDDNNLIFYGNNYLSNEESLSWFKYYLPYEVSCQKLLEKIASFDKESKKFAEWDGQDKDNPNYEQNKIDGLKGTAGEIAPKVNLKDNLNPGSSGRALNVLKNHYGKILIGFGVFEEIVFGKVRKNLPKIFKSKEVKNKNKEKKGAEDNKSASSDVEKERTL